MGQNTRVWLSHCSVWQQLNTALTRRSFRNTPEKNKLLRHSHVGVCVDTRFQITFVKTGIAVQSPSLVQLFTTPWTAARQASLSIAKSRSLLKRMSITSVMPSNHLILCRPLLLPSVFPSIRVFSNESALRIRWPKCWSFCFSVSPSDEYSGLISFRMDWLDLLAVQGALESLLQHRMATSSSVTL